MKKIINLLVVLLVIGTILSLVSGCSTTSKEAEAKNDQQQSLAGQTLFIYCGAGMTKPFGAIADQFKAETGCDMQVVYANAAQLLESDPNNRRRGLIYCRFGR